MSKLKNAREPKNQSSSDLQQFSSTEDLFLNNTDPLMDKIDAFPKYATRQSIAKFLTKYEIFTKILKIIQKSKNFKTFFYQEIRSNI
jgi:hypothetical protein